MEMKVNEYKLDVAEEREVWIKNGELYKTEDYKAIWNISKDKLGCIASNQYNIIQHNDVVNSLTKALENLNIKFNSKLREDTHRIFMDVEFEDAKIELKEVGEEFTCGMRLINSYDKTTGLIIVPMLKRLVCSNGMVMKVFSKGYAIRHNQKLVGDFEAIIERTLNEMINNSENLKIMINKCIGDSVEWELVDTILKNLIGRKKHIEAITLMLEEKKDISRWDLYNAITQYATHGEQLKPSIENWLQNKSQKLLENPLENYIEVESES